MILGCISERGHNNESLIIMAHRKGTIRLHIYCTLKQMKLSTAPILEEKNKDYFRVLNLGELKSLPERFAFLFRRRSSAKSDDFSSSIVGANGEIFKGVCGSCQRASEPGDLEVGQSVDFRLNNFNSLSFR